VRQVESKEIFELVIKADERLKYASADNIEKRREQARELLLRARTEAEAIGNEQLVAQAEQRLTDLDRGPSQA
jgi:hypothetical protein